MSKDTTNPFFVGVGGASSSGKSRVLRSLTALLGRRYTAHVDLDGYHRHDREERTHLCEYPDQPEANDFETLFSDLTALRRGLLVKIPMYNHKTGRFDTPRKVNPKPIIFVEGLHAAAINSICGKKLIDFSVFLHPEEDLRRSWKVRRDVADRSYRYMDAVEQIERRRPFVEQFVLTQREMADVVVQMVAHSPQIVHHRIFLSPTIVDVVKSLQDLFVVSPVAPPWSVTPDSGPYLLVIDVRQEKLTEALQSFGLIFPSSEHNNLKRHTRPESYTNAVRCLAATIIASMMNSRKKE